MKKIMGFYPIFKALMAIIYLILGGLILVLPKSVIPVDNSFRIGFGIVIFLYGIVRIVTSYRELKVNRRLENE